MKTKILIVLLILICTNTYAKNKTYTSKELQQISLQYVNGANLVTVHWTDSLCIWTFSFENGKANTYAKNYYYLSDNKDEKFKTNKVGKFTEGKYLIMSYKSDKIEKAVPSIWELYSPNDTVMLIISLKAVNKDSYRTEEFKIIKKE